jgi:hypothetical protein
MRCPTCDCENDASARTCARCKGPLPVDAATVLPAPAPGEGEAKPRRSRRRRSDPQFDTPFSPCAEGYNRDMQRAYALCLLGLVPFLGLVLGPLAAILASRIRRKAKDDPSFTAHGAAQAALVLGTLSGITNWLGLALMAIGLWV